MPKFTAAYCMGVFEHDLCTKYSDDELTEEQVQSDYAELYAACARHFGETAMEFLQTELALH